MIIIKKDVNTYRKDIDNFYFYVNFSNSNFEEIQYFVVELEMKSIKFGRFIHFVSCTKVCLILSIGAGMEKYKKNLNILLTTC